MPPRRTTNGVSGSGDGVEHGAPPGGQPSVRLRLKKTSNSNVYVGAAPADCKADRGLNKTGVGFAIDGTLRFQKTKIKSSGSG